MSTDGRYVWMNGELVPFEQANVHVLSHSLHYGSAAFEGVRAYRTADGRTAIFKAREHMQRLHQSISALGGTCAYSVDQLVAGAAQLIKANGFDACYLRPLAYIGHETRGLKLPPTPRMHIAIASWPWGKYLGDAAMQQGIKVCISSFRRPDPASSLPWAKLSGNYLNSIMARREATLSGCDEAILLDQQGFVAEGSGENVFVVQGNDLLTPPPVAILPGLTRAAMFDVARMLGYTVKEQSLTRNQLYMADEVFLTGTAAEVTPVGLLDGRKIGAGAPGPVTKKIAELYERATRGDVAECARWLTYV